MCTDNGGEYERKEEHRYPERRRHVPVRYGIDEYADVVSVGLDKSQTDEPRSIEDALASNLADPIQFHTLIFGTITCVKQWNKISLVYTTVRLKR